MMTVIIIIIIIIFIFIIIKNLVQLAILIINK